MKIEVQAKMREGQGTSASRRLRRAGSVPGVVYGADKAAVAIALDHNLLYRQLQQEAFHSSVLTLMLDGANEPVLLRDYQVHPYKQQVLHIDFQRVDKNQKIHVKVPLHFLHGDTCPGVKLGGGIVSHILTEVEVVCLPDSLPEFIEVDLSDLDSGHSVHLSDLKLPAGVEIPALIRGENASVAAIAAVRGGAAASSEGEAAAA